MLSVNLPAAGRIADPNDPSEISVNDLDNVDVGPGADLGLQTAGLTVDDDADPLNIHTKTLKGVPPAADTLATWYSGTAGVTSKPFEPALPLVNKNVSVPGTTLRGVGFIGGTYNDSSVVPLTGAAVEDIRGVHAVFASPVFYPMRLAIANYFDALTSAAGTTRLLITPAQHVYSGSGTSSTLRLYSDIQLKLFYSNNTETRTVDGVDLQPGLAGPPSILDIHAAPSVNAISVETHVVGDPSAGMQEVWVSWTGFDNKWHSANLTQDGADSTHWSGNIPVPTGHSAPEARFMVQAVNGVGLVALDDNFGAYYGVQAAGVSPQSINFATIGDANVNDADFSISPTSTAGLPVHLEAIGPCTVSPATSPATVHITGSGACSITASQVGNATVAPATSVTRTFTIARLAQTITFGTLPDRTFGTPAFTVSAFSTSGLQVDFIASGACTVNVATVSLTGAGSCTITARQAGDGTYAPADDVPQAFNTGKASQSINFGAIAPKTFGDAPFTVSATSSSLLTVAFAASGQCTVNVATVSLTGAGSCTITASQAGDANFNAATSVPQTFAIAKAAGSVSISNIPGSGVAVIGGTFTPAYNKLGTGATSSISTTPSICTVSAGVVSFVAFGTCSLTPSVATDSNYLAATGTPQTFTVNKKPQTITLTSPLTATYGDLYTPTATTNAAPTLTAVTFSLGAGSNCTFASGKFTMTASGTCNIVASQAGSATWAPATQTFAIAIAKKGATLGYTGNLFWSAGSGTSANVTFTGKVTPASGGTVALANAQVDFLLFSSSNMTTPADHCLGTVNSSGVATCTKTGLGLDNWTVVMTIPSTNAYFTAPNADAGGADRLQGPRRQLRRRRGHGRRPEHVEHSGEGCRGSAQPRSVRLLRELQDRHDAAGLRHLLVPRDRWQRLRLHHHELDRWRPVLRERHGIVQRQVLRDRHEPGDPQGRERDRRLELHLPVRRHRRVDRQAGAQRLTRRAGRSTTRWARRPSQLAGERRRDRHQEVGATPDQRERPRRRRGLSIRVG